MEVLLFSSVAGLFVVLSHDAVVAFFLADGSLGAWKRSRGSAGCRLHSESGYWFEFPGLAVGAFHGELISDVPVKDRTLTIGWPPQVFV